MFKSLPILPTLPINLDKRLGHVNGFVTEKNRTERAKSTANLIPFDAVNTGRKVQRLPGPLSG
jgi:hypothetical protein